MTDLRAYRQICAAYSLRSTKLAMLKGKVEDILKSTMVCLREMIEWINGDVRPRYSLSVMKEQLDMRMVVPEYIVSER